MAEFQLRVREAINPLFESQMTIARGCTYLYYLTKSSKLPQIVTDPLKIALFLKGELKPGKGEYYYITTERPDNKAIDSLLDRTFGKAPQAVELQAQIKIGPDDIRSLIPTLSSAEQKTAYAFLAKLIAQSKRTGKAGTSATG